MFCQTTVGEVRRLVTVTRREPTSINVRSISPPVLSRCGEARWLLTREARPLNSLQEAAMAVEARWAQLVQAASAAVAAQLPALVRVYHQVQVRAPDPLLSCEGPF